MDKFLLFLNHYKIFGSIIFFILGTVVGSFLNVVIYRVPKGESIVFPPSHCTSCNHKLSTMDLIPIISYVSLRGKCRYCGEKISPIYPVVEALTGLLFALLYVKFDVSLVLLKYLILVSLLIVVSFIDIREQLVFDSIVIPGAVCGFLLSLPTWRDSLFGILFFFVVYLLIILVSKLFYKEGGMGEGDLTTGVMIGAFVGLSLGIVSFLLSFIVGAIVGVVLLIRNKDSKAEIPFVPYMSIGALLAIFFGNYLISFYLNLF